MKINFQSWRLVSVDKTGIIFTIDGLLALAFIGILILVMQGQTPTTNTTELETNKLIGDLLVTSRELSINTINELETNYLKLFGNRKGYIIVNDSKIEINANDNTKTKLISQRINYINISNHKIHIEVGVYY